MYPNTSPNPNGGPESSFRSPIHILTFLKHVKYIEFGQLMHPQEVIDTLRGSCHDQALLMIWALNQIHLTTKGKFLLAIDNNNIGKETHSFVYFTLQDKFYWIENAWQEYRGMHSFNSEQSLIDHVVSKFAERNPNQTIMLCDFVPEDHKIGEDLSTFVDICTNNSLVIVEE